MKKIMRVLAFALVAVMLLSFAGCSGDFGKIFVIYSDNAFAPFEFLDQNTHTYIGVDMDLLAAIAEDQGFTYELHNDGFDASMNAVQAGRGDAMIAGMTINDARKEAYDFSNGYFEDGIIMVVAADSNIVYPEDLKGQIVAAKKGTTSTAYVESIMEQYGFTLTYFDDSPTMYQAILDGTAVACFEDFSVIDWAIKNESLGLKTLGKVINSGYYGLAVKKGSNAELIQMFNRGLANIKASGKYDEILARYGY